MAKKSSFFVHFLLIFAHFLPKKHRFSWLYKWGIVKWPGW